MKDYDPNIYGYVNGKPVYSRDEFVFMCRGRGPIENDEELMEFAEKVTSHWQNAGWKRSFETFYLSDYALDEPYRSLTKKEFARLQELQKQARIKAKEADDARQWRKIDTCYYADNSVEETWQDKDGNRKTVMTVGPHGDIC